MVAVSLAGSLFFSLSPEASRQQILFYLVINLAPYVLMAPLVEPAIDRLRHGPRNIAVFLFALRAVCAAGLALTLLDLGFYFFARAADRRQGNGRGATGTHPGPRRRQQPARRRQLAWHVST